jgi:hypothetical protein
MPKEILIDADRPDIVEIGALLLTLLTYPKEMLGAAPESGSKNEQAAWSVYLCVCTAAYCAKAETDPQWGHSCQPLKPYFIGVDINQRFLGSMEKRWHRGLVAGRMALIFIEEALTGQVPEELKGIKRVTVEKVCDLLSAQTRLGDAHNFANRIWRLYRPVVHVLAAALHVKELVEPRMKGPVTMAHLVTDPVFIRAVVRKAEEFEGILVKSRHARITEESLLRVRLAA